MGKTRRGKDKAHEAEPFAVRVVDAAGKPIVGARWQVKQGNNWRAVQQLALTALPMVIVMPHGELHGEGVVSRSGKIFRVTA